MDLGGAVQNEHKDGARGEFRPQYRAAASSMPTKLKRLVNVQYFDGNQVENPNYLSKPEEIQQLK